MSRYHRKYSKNSSCWTVEKVKGGKTHNYILELIERVIMQHETGETLLSKNIILSPDDQQNIVCHQTIH